MVNKENKLWIFPAMDFLTAFQKTSYVQTFDCLEQLFIFVNRSVEFPRPDT